MKNRSLYIVLLLFAVCLPPSLATAAIPPVPRQEVARTLTRMTAREVAGGWVKVDRLETSRRKVRIYASIGLSYYPFREQSVQAIYDSVRMLLPPALHKARLEIYTDGHLIETLIPAVYRSSAGKHKARPFVNTSERPLVTRLSTAWTPAAGLRDRHIAVWQSHGRYFDQKQNRWRWQRSRLWQTCEDLYTQGYVLPFLVPMLENAGANVLLPRERDVQKIELIADNDASIGYNTHYEEVEGDRSWRRIGAGFAYSQSIYHAGENPFIHGSARAVESIVSGAESRAVWTADVPRQGEYAVYVAYKTVPNSVDDALYTVSHLGGESRFAVNQTMGGGTWIYLGTFRFAAGSASAVVTLSNRSSRKGRMVTADAVKIGGGMGNMARTVCDSLRVKDVVYEQQMSGYPRFCEGARYWLQWAGFEEEVYTPKDHKDDYKDDYMSRAHWVNALASGSERLPDQDGLRIPLDMALAFHSDAGVRDGDQVVGTLGIFYTKENKGRFEGGADRYLSRDLSDVVMTQVVEDVRRTFEPEWSRRGLWNRAYYEARIPAVPTMLLELLSHQNFADMRYGLDPRFRFVVSRAVYKGILRHVTAQYGTPYVVQPLPVHSFGAELSADREVTLRWMPTCDSLEITAAPKGYVVYTRVDSGGFDAGRLVEDTSCTLTIEQGRIYSYKVTAVNQGGESFPSEILSVCRAPEERGRVLIVNGFSRVSGPVEVRNDSFAGFRSDLDGGVPYLADISFIGRQRVFDCSMARCENDSVALGACGDEYAADVVGGNTFDYPYLHGQAIAAAGWSFCSSSVKAVEQGDVPIGSYDVIDLILGKQRSIAVGRGVRGFEFKTFSIPLQNVLRAYAEQGGALLVSGSYAVSDITTGPNASDQDRIFAREILHVGSADPQTTTRGRVVATPSPAGLLCGDYRFNAELSEDQYVVEQADVISVAGNGAFAVMHYGQPDQPAAVAWVGASRGLVLGFPFESLSDASQRECMMRDALRFLAQNTK